MKILEVLALTDPVDVFAQGWSSDSDTNTPVCAAVGDQDKVRAASDGAGGTFYVWTDNRADDFEGDIYIQRFDNSGLAQWADDGVVVCVAPEHQHRPQVIADGTGGAIIPGKINAMKC